MTKREAGRPFPGEGESTPVRKPVPRPKEHAEHHGEPSEHDATAYSESDPDVDDKA